MALFDPKEWNFKKLRDFQYPGSASVCAYEYKNHPTVDGTPDFLRLNLYLSMDKNYVTIWNGLLEPIFTESRLESVEKPPDFDFGSTYNTPLFRGYIESQEAAKHILKALRIGESNQYSAPQILSGGSDNKLRCSVVRAA